MTKREQQLIEALEAIAGVLEMPRDRLGRLDMGAAYGKDWDAAHTAREALRQLAMKYDATTAPDYMGQCAAVARAVIAGKQ
jgi:hypothetical protein